MDVGTISFYRKGSKSDLVGNAAAYDVDLRQIHMHTYITTVAAIALTSPYGVYIFHFKKGFIGSLFRGYYLHSFQ